MSPTSLRIERLRVGLTQQQLASKAHIATRTVHAIEQGRSCRQDTKRRLLRALGVPWAQRELIFHPSTEEVPSHAPTTQPFQVRDF